MAHIHKSQLVALGLNKVILKLHYLKPENITVSQEGLMSIDVSGRKVGPAVQLVYWYYSILLNVYLIYYFMSYYSV